MPGAEVTQGFALKPATPADAALVQRRSGEFFDDVERHIRAGELFLTNREAECVSFGILERSDFRSGVASIGVFTIEEFRGAGVGAATIELLVRACVERGLHAIAGCWYYNHASKRTLERAGMVSRTRLLRFEF